MRDLERKLIFSRRNTGSVLYRQGENADSIFFVLEGRIKMSAIAVGVKSALLKIASPGEVLGLAEVLAGKWQLTTAQVSAPSFIAVLRRDHFASAMRNYPQLSEAVAQALATQCKESVVEMLLLRVPCSSSQRLAAALVRLARGEHRATPASALTYTHAELGQLIGASRETVTRLMKTFERRGVIKTRRSLFELTDSKALADIARVD